MLKALLLKFAYFLVASLGKPLDKIQPTSTERIGHYKLHMLLNDSLPDASVYMSDRQYLLCNKKDIETFLAQDKTNKGKFVPERYDCDDFSYRLMGQLSIPGWSDLAFGIVWTDKHALNCFVDEDGDFYFVEPQTDEILTELKAWMGNKFRLVVM